MNYELHPLSSLFPRMVGAEFDALRDDIRANGLRQPIVLHDGRILDGGNRYRACIEAGVRPTFVEFAGGSIVAFVLSANLHRRHMTPGQQAAIVASAQDWAKAQGVGNPAFSQSGNLAPLATIADRAAQSGASERTQKMADKVAREAPELAIMVAHGEVSLPVAVEQITGKRPGQKQADVRAASPQEKPGPIRSVKPDTKSEAPDEIKILKARIEELQSLLAEQVAQAEAMNTELMALHAAMEASDELAEAGRQIAKLAAENVVLRDRLSGSKTTENEAKRSAMSWKSKYERLAKEVGRGSSI